MKDSLGSQAKPARIPHNMLTEVKVQIASDFRQLIASKPNRGEEAVGA